MDKKLSSINRRILIFTPSPDYRFIHRIHQCHQINADFDDINEILHRLTLPKKYPLSRFPCFMNLAGRATFLIAFRAGNQACPSRRQVGTNERAANLSRACRGSEREVKPSPSSAERVNTTDEPAQAGGERQQSFLIGIGCGLN